MSLNPSIILSVKMTCHRTFYLFIISSFPTVILSVYIKKIFLSVFTNCYYDGIFNWINLLQFTDIIFLSTCPFVFANFFC